MTIVQTGYKRYLDKTWNAASTYGIPNKMQAGITQAAVAFTDTDLTSEIVGFDATADLITVDLTNLQVEGKWTINLSDANTNTIDGLRFSDSSDVVHAINKIVDVNKTSSVIIKVTRRERRNA